jgi:hypothetical protein
MTTDEVVTALRFLRYARPTLTTLAREANVSHTLLYEAVKTGQLSERTRAAVERALMALQNQRGYIR